MHTRPSAHFGNADPVIALKPPQFSPSFAYTGLPGSGLTIGGRTGVVSGLDSGLGFSGSRSSSPVGDSRQIPLLLPKDDSSKQ